MTAKDCLGKRLCLDSEFGGSPFVGLRRHVAALAGKMKSVKAASMMESKRWLPPPFQEIRREVLPRERNLIGVADYRMLAVILHNQSDPSDQDLTLGQHTQ